MELWNNLFHQEQQRLYGTPIGSDAAQIQGALSSLRGMNRPEHGMRPDLDTWLQSSTWLQVTRVGYYAPGALDRPEQRTSPLVGLSQLGHPCAFLIRGSADQVAFYWGIAAPSDTVLRAALTAAWSELELHTPNVAPTHDLNQFRAAQAWSGLPSLLPATVSASASTIVPNQPSPTRIDVLLRSMRGMQGNWAWVLVFHPVSLQHIFGWQMQVAERIRQVRINFLQPNQPGQFRRDAEEYAQLLEDYLTLLQQGQAEGGWLAYGLALADQPAYIRYLQSALTTAFAGEQSRPEPWRLRPAGLPNPQINWVGQLTFLPSQRLSLMADLPTLEVPGLAVGHTPLFDLVPPRPATSATGKRLTLGTILDGQRLTSQPFILDIQDLQTHLFVAGITGAGKSNTVKLLVGQAVQQGIPVLIIEPVKQEYRRLTVANLRVLALGTPECSLRLNPFAFEGVGCATHLDHLKALFAAAYVLYPPMPYVLEQALHEIYQDRGWDLVSGICWRQPADHPPHPLAFPTLTDLHRKVGEVIERAGYDRRLAADIQAGLQIRINNLRLGAKGALLDTHATLTLAELMQQPTIIELQSIGDAEQRAFLMGLLLTKIYEGCLGYGPSDTLRLLVVLEEAHRLLEDKGSAATDTQAHPQAQAIQTFADMLAEMRAYGIGFIIAEQSPSRITRQVLKNTASKIAHQLVDAPEWRVMAESMALSEAEGRAMAILPRGQALVFTPTMDRPIRVTVAPAPAGRHDPRPTPALVSATTPSDQPRLNALHACLTVNPQVETMFHHLMYSFLHESIPHIQRTWQHLVQSVYAAAPTRIGDDTLLHALLRRTAETVFQQCAARAGRVFGWDFGVEEQVAIRLTALIPMTIAGQINENHLHDLRTYVHPHMRARPPFAGCDGCPAPCRYRIFILLAEASWANESIVDLFQTSPDNRHMMHALLERQMLQITLENQDSQHREALLRCLVAHQAQYLPYGQQVHLVQTCLAEL